MSTTTTKIIGDTLLVVASKDLRELESNCMDSEGEDIMQKLENPRLRNVVIDLSGTDYYGSSALNLFLRIENKTHTKNGQLVLVGLSPHEKEILHVTRLEGRWMTCDTQEEAFRVCEAPFVSQ